jgi:acyl-CoA synthetase (AMP-forming)/AMP-acid ligase II
MWIGAGGHFTAAATTFGDRPALRDQRRTLGYGELRQRANRLGSALRRRGLVTGGRVALLSHNRVEVVETWLGLERAGLVRVVLHSHFDMPVHVRTLADVEAEVLIFDARFASAVAAHRAAMASVKHFIAIGSGAPERAEPYERLLASGSPEDPGLDVDETAPCAIQLTTGTTGAPKPWVVSHRAWRTLIVHNQVHLDNFSAGGPAIGPDDVNLHVHALQWASGAQTLMPYLLRGALNVILDDAAFDPTAVVDAIVAEGATGAFLPGPMVPPLLSLIKARGGIAHRLRRLVIFFATPELLAMVGELLGPVWCHGFGSTEQGAPATRLTSQDAVEKPERLNSVGRAASPLIELAVTDEQGHPLPPRVAGEIVVRSAMSDGSYWNLPEKTASAFFSHGWFRPGDIGYLDEEGFLYYLDRANDRIESAAGVVYPHVVETAVLRHAAVANCGVVGLGVAGRQSIVAAVTLKPGVSEEMQLEREIMTLAGAGLARHEVPDRIVIVDNLPTVLGGAKVRRDMLRQRLAALRASA